ncbi:helix-turn-helix transcriptional regulator [Salinibacillus aidingensis]|uniref:Helix-turn-helix transcriptional regulator n=1 Tax=Salinibacillus aidingensis TaxID=237684 RepID=A0ABN1B621_9BACI
MLSKRLSYLRKKHNFNQDEMSKKIGVARTTYAMYEQGRRNPDYEVLEKIADFFEVTTDYLLGRSDNPEMTEEEAFDAFINDPELERWYKELPKSKEEDLRRLRKIWEAFKDEE